MATQRLSDLNRTELEKMARSRNLEGWKSMKKDELIAALSDSGKVQSTERLSKKKAGSAGKTTKSPAKIPDELPASAVKKEASEKSASSGSKSVRKSSSAKKVSKTQVTSSKSRNTLTAKSRGKRTTDLTPTAEALLKRDLAHQSESIDSKGEIDRFVVLVRDPFWLQAVWDFSRSTIQRAEVALGADWHRAVPTLRLCDVSGHDSTSRSEAKLLDITIHGGVNFWYIPIDGQPRSYRLLIGYLVPGGKFQVLSRSNVVTPPRPGTPGTISGGWDDLKGEYQRVYALSGGYSETAMSSPLKSLLEERIGRPLGSWNSGGRLDDSEMSSLGGRSSGQIPLTMHAELILHGITEPDCQVTVVEEPTHVKPDGSFSVRMALEDGRHLIQTVVARPDRNGQRTIILSIERNTKELDTQSWESS